MVRFAAHVSQFAATDQCLGYGDERVAVGLTRERFLGTLEVLVLAHVKHLEWELLPLLGRRTAP